MADLIQIVEDAITDTHHAPPTSEYRRTGDYPVPESNRQRLLDREWTADCRRPQADGWLYCHPHDSGNGVWLHQRIRWEPLSRTDLAPNEITDVIRAWSWHRTHCDVTPGITGRTHRRPINKVIEKAADMHLSVTIAEGGELQLCHTDPTGRPRPVLILHHPGGPESWR